MSEKIFRINQTASKTMQIFVEEKHLLRNFHDDSDFINETETLLLKNMYSTILLDSFRFSWSKIINSIHCKVIDLSTKTTSTESLDLMINSRDELK